jgi:hypothetical protein
LLKLKRLASVRSCIACRVPFEQTGHNARCNQCRSAWDKAWRIRRKAEGRPVVSTKMPPGYEAQRKLTYYSRDEVKKRRAANMQKYRNDPQLRAKHEARWAVSRALVAGRLTRQPCEVCGTRAQAHHDDYAKPLTVRWLCLKHHRAHHAQAEAAGITAE